MFQGTATFGERPTPELSERVWWTAPPRASQNRLPLRLQPPGSADSLLPVRAKAAFGSLSAFLQMGSPRCCPWAVTGQAVQTPDLHCPPCANICWTATLGCCRHCLDAVCTPAVTEVKEPRMKTPATKTKLSRWHWLSPCQVLRDLLAWSPAPSIAVMDGAWIQKELAEASPQQLAQP